MTPQQKSDKYEKRLNAGNAIVREAMTDFAALVVEVGLSQADADEIEAARQVVRDALDAYCALLRAKASGGGVTPQSGGGPKD